MKPRNAREIAYQVLRGQRKEVYNEELLGDVFRSSKVDQRERSLALELVNGVTRMQGNLDHIASQFLERPAKKVSNKLKPILRMGLYQIFYTSKIPDHAIVDTAVEMAKQHADIKGSKFINAVLRLALGEKENIRYPRKSKNPGAFISVKYSHPIWMVKNWIKDFGVEDTIKLCEWNNAAPSIYLRANGKKTTPAKLRSLLFMEGHEAEIFQDDYVLVKKPGDISALSAIKEGLAIVQDPSSGLVCKLADVRKHEIVLDLCAAPGGKTGVFAEKGRIVAADISFKRLERVKQNLSKLGLMGLLVTMDGRFPCFRKRLFDKVIVDAPCSNTGVLRRRPEARWNRSFSDVKRLSILQLELLQGAASLLKPGGILVYSTCSLERQENEQVVKSFLEKSSRFAIENARNHVNEEYVNKKGFLKILPFRHDLDGMFAARLKKAE